MCELAEDVWKLRFAQRLQVFFVSRGASPQNALADAHAHAEGQYVARGNGTPEEHAEAEIAAIQAEFDA